MKTRLFIDGSSQSMALVPLAMDMLRRMSERGDRSKILIIGSSRMELTVKPGDRWVARISTALGGTFIVFPYMRTAAAEVVQQGSEYLTFSAAVVPTVPDLTVVSNHPWRGASAPVVSARLSAFGGPIGYFSGGAILSTTTDTTAQTAAATPAGSPTVLLGVRGDSTLRNNANTSVGTLTSSWFTFDLSRDGTKLLYQDGSLNYRLATLNYALLPSSIVVSDVVPTIAGLASPYGTTSVGTSVARNVSGTRTTTVDSSSTIVAGQSAAGAIVRTYGDRASTVAETIACSFPTVFSVYDRTITTTGTETITLPSGATITATTSSAASANFSHNGGTNANTSSSSASGAAESLTVLWADASASCALIRKTTTTQSGTGSSSGVGGVGDTVTVGIVAFNVTTQRTYTYYWLSGTTARQVHQVVETALTGQTVTAGTVPNSDNVSSSVTNITSPPWSSVSPRAPATAHQATASLTNDGKSYIAQFTPDGTSAPLLFGSTDPTQLIISRMREVIAARAPSGSNTTILNDIDSNNLSGYRFGLTTPDGTKPVACVK